MYCLSLQPVLLEPPIDLVPSHMPSGQPTRTPGTPVGELLARRPLQTVQSDFRPKPSKRPSLPVDFFCSDSDSDATEIALSPSPANSLDKPDDKPKPSAAPHLRLPADALQPTDESLSLSMMEFGHQIDFDFCKIGPRPILKALSWLSRNADIAALQPLMQASLIKAFLTPPTSVAGKRCLCL